MSAFRLFSRLSFPPLLMVAILVVCLFSAEHYYPADVVNGSTADFLVDSHEGNPLRRAAYLTIGAIGLTLILREKRRFWTSRTQVSAWAACLFTWSGISISWSEEPAVAARRFAVLLLMYLGAIGITRTWSYQKIVRFIAIAAAIHLGVGVLAEIAMGYFTPLDINYRFAGTLRWNEQGLACLFLCMSSLVAAEMGRFIKTFRLLFLFGITFLVLTKSRSSMIGLLTGLAVYGSLTRDRRTKLRALAATASVFVILIPTGLIGETYEFLSRQGEGVENFTGRQPLWHEVLEFAKDRPVLGYGYEDFWTAKRVDYFSEELHWGISASHSGYLESLVTLGVVGLLLHYTLLIAGLVSGALLYGKTHSRIFALSASVCGTFLVVGFLEAVLVVKASPVSFYFALLLSVLCFPKEQDDLYLSSLQAKPWRSELCV